MTADIRTAAQRDDAVAAIERLRKLHCKIEASAVTGDCATEECEHEEECPTEIFEVCAECWNLCESADPYFGERSIAPVLWPCPTAVALDGAPEPETAPENYKPKCNGACVVHGIPVTNWPVQYGRRNRETGALHWLTGDPRDDWWHENQDRYEHVKMYTSPPLPVEGESKP